MESLAPLQTAGSRHSVSPEYLCLSELALKPGEQWALTGEGLFLIFPSKGELAFTSGRVSRRLGPGDALVASQSGQSPVRVAARNQAAFRSFSIRLEQLYPLFAGEEIPLLQVVASGLRIPRVYAASTSVARECHRSLQAPRCHSQLLRRTDLLRVAATLLAEEFSQARQTRHAGYVCPEDHLTSVLERLTAEDILNLSVNELADKFSLSRRHLNRMFQEHFGLSVGTLRMEMRLLRAMSLLRDPSAKVIHVAELSGFNHLGLFNICFRRRFGMNPSQCRKRAGESRQWLDGRMQPNGCCAMRAAGLCAWSDAVSTDSEAAGKDALVSRAPIRKRVPAGAFEKAA